ncbi:MAG: hypothetical protein ACRAVC_13120 [Trichormus sp.]
MMWGWGLGSRGQGSRGRQRRQGRNIYPNARVLTLMRFTYSLFIQFWCHHW